MEITDKGRRRVVCGLRWEPNRGNAKFDMMTSIKGINTQTFDLDLMCVIYDRDGGFLGGISGTSDESVDDSGKIYHSGDDTAGMNEHDDEQIFVELTGLPPEIHHIVFIAEVQSRHTFGTVDTPEIRLADSYSERSFLHASLQQDGQKDKTAFVFARMYRAGQMWMLHHIGEFYNSREVADWVETCRAYLRT